MKNVKETKNIATEPSANMTRKERRSWFHLNRKSLDLPRWSELHNLDANK